MKQDDSRPGFLESCGNQVATVSVKRMAGTGRPFMYEITKRCVDAVAAVLLLVLFAPLLFSIALMVRLSDGKTVLYRQERVGRYGKPFEILKFRTMCRRHAGAADRTITRIGRFLRCYSLDELPQLINVLKGDMSLVGPRPHIQEEEEMYAVRLHDYARRWAVRPGITGLAQVEGYNGPVLVWDDIFGRFKHDLDYIQRRSLLLDFKILLRTFPLLLFGRRRPPVQVSRPQNMNQRFQRVSTRPAAAGQDTLQTPGV